MKNNFSNIYKYNLWIFGSGTGSVSINNKPYLYFLQPPILCHSPQSNLTQIFLELSEEIFPDINSHGF